MKKVVRFVVLFIITICIIGMMQTKSNASKMEINKEKKTLYVGATYYLKIKGTSKKVKWTSSNKNVATVNSRGKVTAKKKGTTEVNARVLMTAQVVL